MLASRMEVGVTDSLAGSLLAEQPAVADVLREALRQPGEQRLVSATKKEPGLISGRSGKVRDSLIATCVRAEAGLFAVRTEEDSKGKPVYFVTPTRTGIVALVAVTPPDDWENLLRNIHADYWDDVNHAIGEHLERSVDQCNAHIQEIAARRQTLLTKLIDRLTVTMKTLADEQRQAEQLQERLKQFTDSFSTPSLEETPRAETPSVSEWVFEGERHAAVSPTNDGFEFQRDLAVHLVQSWQDAIEPAALDALERVMVNIGLEPTDHEGETVHFDGRRHLATEPIEPGTKAVVTRSGWQLVNLLGVYPVARARVQAAVSRVQGSAHEPHAEH